MKEFIVLAIAAVLVCCHKLPEPDRATGSEVALLVSGVAPGQLTCVLRNNSSSNWGYDTQDGNISFSLSFWNGSEWVPDVLLGCGNGFGYKEIGPSEEVTFEVFARHSRPEVEVRVLCNRPGEKRAMFVTGEPPRWIGDSEYFSPDQAVENPLIRFVRENSSTPAPLKED